METTPAIIATQRFPLKKDNQSGSFGILELVIAHRTDDSGKDSDKRIRNLVKCQSLGCAVSDRRHNSCYNSG